VRDDYDRARSQASEALMLSQQLEDPRGIAWGFEVFAGVLAAEGHVDSAARLWGVSDRLFEGVGGALSPEISWIRDRCTHLVERSPGSEDLPLRVAKAERWPSITRLRSRMGGFRPELERSSARNRSRRRFAKPSRLRSSSHELRRVSRLPAENLSTAIPS
jgi:hypothetical protein